MIKTHFVKFTTAVLFAALAIFASSCAPSTDATEPSVVSSTKNATSIVGNLTETVTNRSHEFVNVTMNLADNSQFFYGSAPNTSVQLTIPAAAVGILVNGVNVPANVATTVSMPDGKQVTVTWDNQTNVVVVVDTLEMN